MGYRASRLAMRASILGAVSVFSVLMTLGVAAADWFQPDPITNEAQDMHELYLLVLIMGTVVWALVTAALAFILVRYRKKNDELPPQIHGNNVLEIIWTAIPIIIVLILFVFSFIVLIEVDDEAEQQDLTVDVLGFQFSWQFTYNLQDLGPSASPEEGTFSVVGNATTRPEVVIPVNEPVEFRLNSADVIHSFYFRNGLYKLDVIPGRENKFVVTANETGTFDGQCAELCGLNHAEMLFTLRVVTREEFDAWVAEHMEEPADAAAQQPR